VSLPRSDDRRRHITSHLEATGIASYKFFDATGSNDFLVQAAVDAGHVATFPPCFRCGKLDCGRPDCNNFLTKAQIATFITYRRLWQELADGTSERILVVEDDVKFHGHAIETLERLAEEIESRRVPFTERDSCLLRLGWAACEEHQKTEEFRVVEAVRMSNPCHALTRKFARRLLQEFRGIRHTVDVYQHAQVPRKGEAFTILPPIASELSWSEGSFDSTIHPKPIRADYLARIGAHQESSEHERIVHLHVKKKVFRPLLLTGHPRCGTGFAASLCRQLGVDVGHERMGKAGIASWMFAVDAEENPYFLDEAARTRRTFAWDSMIAVVRDIAVAVASVMRDSLRAPPSYQFRRDQILRELALDLDSLPSDMERAVWSITSWYRIILGQNPDLCFRVEDQHEQVRSHLRAAGLLGEHFEQQPLDVSPVNAEKLYKGVFYPKPIVSVDAWQSLSAAAKAEVAWYCQRFGYPDPTIERAPEQ
jgi:GR25 family glycosyltransferase involved in LPS biosynthesis